MTPWAAQTMKVLPGQTLVPAESLTRQASQTVMQAVQKGQEWALLSLLALRLLARTLRQSVLSCILQCVVCLTAGTPSTQQHAALANAALYALAVLCTSGRHQASEHSLCMSVKTGRMALSTATHVAVHPQRGSVWL